MVNAGLDETLSLKAIRKAIIVFDDIVLGFYKDM